MIRTIWIISIFISSFIVAVPGIMAGDFDGSRPLLVSVIRAIECTPDGTCTEVTPASIQLPQFLKIDFAKKVILPAADDDSTPPTKIERHEVVDGKFILQGAEDGYDELRDGLGWTMAISQDSGQVVLTASGDQVAFVIFGAALLL